MHEPYLFTTQYNVFLVQYQEQNSVNDINIEIYTCVLSNIRFYRKQVICCGFMKPLCKRERPDVIYEKSKLGIQRDLGQFW